MYNDNEIQEKIIDIAQNYQLDVSRVKKYYDILSRFPIFTPDDEGFYCLEHICQDRAFILEEFKRVDKDEYAKNEMLNNYRYTVEYCIQEALYNTYDEQAIYFLKNEYMRINQIRQFDRGNYYYGVQEEYYDRQDEEDEGITLNLINM